MIESIFYSTERLKVHTLQRIVEAGNQFVLLLHGNASSSFFWNEIMEMIPQKFNLLAPDFRGYGKTEDKLIDATRGFADQAEDIIGLLDFLDLEKVHVVGHSMGGGPIYYMMANHAERLQSVTLVNPVSPFGFGGTKDVTGTPVWDDYAGTGAGVVNPEFAKRMGAGDRSEDDPNASPRVVMNNFYWKPPFRAKAEEELLTALLEQKIGNQKYPGDSFASKNWPGVAPGVYGPVNAASPKYVHGLAEEVVDAKYKVPVLWVRGSDDQIVSNNSLFDVNVLGKLGVLPGYPGEDMCPPQPMVDQTRAILAKYSTNESKFIEEVIADTGHSPFIEKPKVFMNVFQNFLEQ